MGKKHKKHHKSEKRERDEEEDYQEKQSEKHDKPLKMVIKIGSGETAEQTSVSEDRPHEEKKHKHKKKKKKKEKDKDKERHKHHHHEHKRHHESHSETKYQESTKETTESEIDVEDGEPPAKRALLQSHDQASREAAEMYERKLREPRSCTLNKSEDPLKPLLEYLQRFLMRKDVNGFFAFPVNDIIAPGYSSIISHPMDLSTMQAKIDREEYQTAAEYKADFMLMLDNAMTYNRPDTIYYKAAKKLQGMGMKMMSKERLLNMKRTLPFMQNITLEQLGIEDDPADTEPKKPKKVQVKSSAIVHEATPDNLTPKEILAQAQAAAKDAGDKLSLRRPESKVSVH
ncbi:bromodomain-containing protein 9-like [Lingula anatina]|uniref:Bromodomain-containing protein 9-like n=1 Tax=Lingula anatina TaxID=7574 RepID=A0A1S3IWB8_LINAN|nr:bromodomain-containing protein 9-like [Lingula anatina]|eukprot:XP_013402358.1 bromodomain-containing protein 9-like [Lingula anatina]